MTAASSCSLDLAWARRIVEETYDSVWRPLRKHCAKLEQDRPLLAYTHCMRTRAHEIDAPWWAQTLLRDQHRAHTLWFPRDNRGDFIMCRLPKVGSTSWAAAHSRAALRAQMKPWMRDNRPMEQLRASHGAPGAFTAVFLRDPLERFVSGFLDKCAGVNVVEGHCGSHPLHRNGTRSGLMRAVSSSAAQRGASKAALELFADTVPLQWNMHFIPQALACDELGRTLQNYSFVGVMNATYRAQIRQLLRAARGDSSAEKSSTAFEAAVRQEFLNRPSRPTNKPAKSPLEHVSRSAAARLLRLYSLDYFELGLPLPGWLGCL